MRRCTNIIRTLFFVALHMFILILGSGPSTTPASTGPCKNAIPNCDQYGQSACTGQFLPWAKANCPVYCNLCGTYHKLLQLNCHNQVIRAYFSYLSLFMAKTNVFVDK